MYSLHLHSQTQANLMIFFSSSHVQYSFQYQFYNMHFKKHNIRALSRNNQESSSESEIIQKTDQVDQEIDEEEAERRLNQLIYVKVSPSNYLEVESLSDKKNSFKIQSSISQIRDFSQRQSPQKYSNSQLLNKSENYQQNKPLTQKFDNKSVRLELNKIINPPSVDEYQHTPHFTQTKQLQIKKSIQLNKSQKNNSFSKDRGCTQDQGTSMLGKPKNIPMRPNRITYQPIKSRDISPNKPKQTIKQYALKEYNKVIGTRVHYYDRLFPPSPSSLSYPPKAQKTITLKLTKPLIFPLIPQSLTPILYKALSLIGEDLIYRIMQNQNVTHQGIYFVRLFVQGIWRYIIIDDWVKQKRKQGLSLVQKAIAKVFGTYQQIQKASLLSILTLLTGYPIIQIPKESVIQQYYKRSIILIQLNDHPYWARYMYSNQQQVIAYGNQQEYFQQLLEWKEVKRVWTVCRRLGWEYLSITLRHLSQFYSQAQLTIKNDDTQLYISVHQVSKHHFHSNENIYKQCDYKIIVYEDDRQIWRGDNKSINIVVNKGVFIIKVHLYLLIDLDFVVSCYSSKSIQLHRSRGSVWTQ